MPSTLRSPVDFRELMKRVEEVVEAIEPAEDLDDTIGQLASEVILRFRDELGIFGGRVYAREGDAYILEAVFPDLGDPLPRLRVPIGYEPILQLLDERTIYMDRDDPHIDREIEAPIRVEEFAAVEVGDQAYILAFDIESDRNREDVLISLSILRSVINQKLRQERMEGALREARRIQASILPRRIPRLEGFDIACRTESMELVGGDFYDAVPMTEKVLGLAIADVSGHGLPAALLVRDVHMGLRMGLSRDFKISRMVERLNDIIHHSTLTSRFVSLFYGELESTGTFIYVNAGHPPPFFLGADGEVERLAEGGAVIGPIRGSTYERGFVRLRGGDLVLLFTDGMIECENGAGEMFGVDRLVEVVESHRNESADAIVEAAFTAIEAFNIGLPPNDDRTMMIVKNDSSR
jgi:sigma-B regulation protein RsbU (phosphoserine phosphatase)